MVFIGEWHSSFKGVRRIMPAIEVLVPFGKSQWDFFMACFVEVVLSACLSSANSEKSLGLYGFSLS